ncbi:hypothetical protein M9Y10_045151 [Tritrichomonas musculus]|uniref:Uncharacterized protein n=1 Tax=Tritrichomonas musculus TaxID=1915356 RepID=A0ABR2JUF6_9EUKA
MAQYINTIPATNYKITSKPGDKQQEIVFDTSTFFFNTLIGCDKNSALIKNIKERKDLNYIIVVSTTNIDNDFFSALFKSPRSSCSLFKMYKKTNRT